MQIGSIHSQHLTQALHLQFAGEAKGLIEKYDPSVLKIVPQFEEFRISVEKEDLCYKIIRKSDLSEAKENADQERDTLIVGINDSVRAALRHFSPAVNEAAKRLKILLDAYNTPKPLQDLPYDAETVAVNNLLQEFDGKYSADVQITGLTSWVAELRQRNDKFDRLAKAYNEQQAAKPLFKFKDVRYETDKAYKKIVLVVNAMVVMEGEYVYAPFITELNALIKHYNDLIAQHIGRNSAKKQNATNELSGEENNSK
jgi:hypothetical protein